jgi:hypothetical protein
MKTDVSTLLRRRLNALALIIAFIGVSDASLVAQSAKSAAAGALDINKLGSERKAYRVALANALNTQSGSSASTLAARVDDPKPTDSDINAALGSAGYALESGAFWFPKEDTGTGGVLAKYNLTQLKTNIHGTTTENARAFIDTGSWLDCLPFSETSLGLGTTLKKVSHKKSTETGTPWMILLGFGLGSFTADNSDVTQPRYAARIKLNIGYAHFHGNYKPHDQLVLGASVDYQWLTALVQKGQSLLGGESTKKN